MQNKYRCSHIRKAWERAQRRWICRCRTNIGVHILERHGNEHREGGYADAEPNIGVHILERHGNEHREGGYVDAGQISVFTY